MQTRVPIYDTQGEEIGSICPFHAALIYKGRLRFVTRQYGPVVIAVDIMTPIVAPEAGESE